MSAEQHQSGPPENPPPLLLSLQEQLLTTIIELLPSQWLGDLRATCQQLQLKVDATGLRRIVVGERGMLPMSGLSSIPLRFKAAGELLLSYEHPMIGVVAHASAFEEALLPHLAPLPDGCLPKVTKIGWHRPANSHSVTFRTAAQLLRVCPNLRSFGGLMICGPDPAAQIPAAGDLGQIIASDKLEEVHVHQVPIAVAAAAGDDDGGGDGGGDNGGGGGGAGGADAALNWLALLPNLRHLVFDGPGREALISALPALTALTYLQMYMVEEQVVEVELPLNSSPALRELSFMGYYDFDRVLAHLESCRPLTGLTCLDLWNYPDAPAPSLGSHEFSMIHRACPNIQELRLNGLAVEGPLSPATVFQHLTSLVFEEGSVTDIRGEDEELEAFRARIPLLRAAMPRLQKLYMGSNSWCTPELITGCTSLQQVALDDPSLAGSYDLLGEWMRAVAAAGVPAASCSLCDMHFTDLAPLDERKVAALVYGWAQDLRGTRSVMFGVHDGCVQLVMLLRPLAAGLAGGQVKELTVKSAVGTAEEAASALLCLQMLQRLERLVIDFDVKPHGIGAVPPPVPSEETLRSLLAPLPALRVSVPALRRIDLRLPVQAAAPRGGTISCDVVADLCSLNPGLSIEFC